MNRAAAGRVGERSNEGGGGMSGVQKGAGVAWRGKSHKVRSGETRSRLNRCGFGATVKVPAILARPPGMARSPAPKQSIGRAAISSRSFGFVVGAGRRCAHRDRCNFSERKVGGVDDQRRRRGSKIGPGSSLGAAWWRGQPAFCSAGGRRGGLFDGRGAVGVGKRDAALGEAVEVRRLHLRRTPPKRCRDGATWAGAWGIG